MPRRRHQLGPADYAVLGLLALKPRHGYELAALLGPRGDLGMVCTLGFSSLYALLHTLEGVGHVRAHASRDSGGPPRKVFRLTGAGTEVFARWLDRPVRRIREIRQDFLLKLFFSERLAGHPAARLIDRQAAACRSYLEELRRATAEAAPCSFTALVLSSRENAARATIAWLAERRRLLRRQGERPAKARLRS